MFTKLSYVYSIMIQYRRKLLKSALLIYLTQSSLARKETTNLLYCLSLRFGSKIVEQNIENKNDRIHKQLFRIIIRVYTIHMKRSSHPRLIFTSHPLRWPARSTPYQVLSPSSRAAALPPVQSARPASHAHPGVRAALRGLQPLLPGAQCSVGRCHHRRFPCLKKKDRRRWLH